MVAHVAHARASVLVPGIDDHALEVIDDAPDHARAQGNGRDPEIVAEGLGPVDEVHPEEDIAHALGIDARDLQSGHDQDLEIEENGPLLGTVDLFIMFKTNHFLFAPYIV